MFELHHNLDSKLVSDWQALYSAQPVQHLNQSPFWAKSYLESNPGVHPLFLTFYSSNKLVGLIGLEEGRVGLTKGYTTLSHTVSHRACLLLHPRYLHAYRRAYRKNKLHQPICLQNLIDSELLTVTAIFGKENLTLLTSHIYPTRSLITDNTGEVSIKARSHLVKRARTILSQLKLVEYRGSRLTTGLHLAFDIDASSTKQASHYNVFASPAMRNFYLRIASDDNLIPYLACYILKHGKVPIAYEIGFVHQDSYADSERAYLASYSQYTPGKVMMVLLLEELGRRGVKLFDFGPGVDNLKRTLATDYEVRTNIVISHFILNRLLIVWQERLLTKLYNYVFAHHAIYKIYRSLKRAA